MSTGLITGCGGERYLAFEKTSGFDVTFSAMLSGYISLATKVRQLFGILSSLSTDSSYLALDGDHAWSLFQLEGKPMSASDFDGRHSEEDVRNSAISLAQSI